MILVSQMKFNPGPLVITPDALAAISAEDICNAMNRHVVGNWGDVDAEGRQANERALRNGSRLLSVYHTASGARFYILTEADRNLTTVHLPEDDRP